jgi:flagellar M-ring protein FliF
VDRVRALLTSLQTLFGGLPRVQQFAIVAGVIGALGVVVALSAFTQQPEMTVAFRGLAATDAAQIVQKLKDSRTQFDLADNGSTIRVPPSRVQEIKLEMAAAGLPQNGTIGWEIFNQSGLASLGMTEFSQRVNLQRAMEGELSRTISRLENLETAQVRLVLPQDRLLQSQQKEATAAVVVKLKQRGLEPVRELGPDQVRAIQFLLSRSVEGLKPDNVTIVDTNGNDLSERMRQIDKERQSPQMSQKQRDTQKEIELQITRDLTAMLERALGPNRALVRVNATLNWDQITQDSRYFVPPATVPDARPNVARSQQQVEEKFAGVPGALPVGVPGIPSNVGPGAQAATNIAAPGAPIAYERKDTITNYEISETVEKLVRSPGAIERMTVAVMLDGPMEEIQVQAIERTVAAAAGIKAERGDSVTVASMPFDKSVQEAQRRQMQESAQLEFYYNMAKVGAAVLISLFVLLFLRSMLVRPSMTSTIVGPQVLPGTALTGVGDGVIEPYEDEAEEAYDEYDEEGGEEYAEGGADEDEEEDDYSEDLPAPEMLEELEAPIEIPEIASPEEERIREMEERLREAQERRQALEEQVFNLARNNPEALADLIKTWLEEEEEVRN